MTHRNRPGKAAGTRLEFSSIEPREICDTVAPEAYAGTRRVEKLMVELLGTIALVGNGLVAGVFFAVAVSVLPTLVAMPVDRYIETHVRLGHGYHPIMPLVVTGGLIADVVLVFIAPGTTSRVLFVVAVVLILGVQAVSQFGNVPINRRVQAVDPQDLPADWTDPRPPWRSWHRLRTALAILALAVNAFALALV